jgi:hypothetical protein
VYEYELLPLLWSFIVLCWFFNCVLACVYMCLCGIGGANSSVLFMG